MTILCISCGNEGQREKEELQQKFSNLRPEVLETLRMSKPSLICHALISPRFSGTCGHEEAAYSLAEHYQDFTSLVALCHRETVFPPEENPNAERIQAYIQQFKEDFTTELFQWYIQHGGYSSFNTII
jgi:nuclear pore complex protein Nup133